MKHLGFTIIVIEALTIHCRGHIQREIGVGHDTSRHDS